MNNEKKLLELAHQKFGELSEADVKLFKAVANGNEADFSAENEEDNDPENAETWGDKRVLEANRIHWLCTDPHASALATHQGIWIDGARIDGTLDLSNTKIAFPLVFLRSVFGDEISIHEAEIPTLNLGGTHTKSIYGDWLKLKGHLFLRNGFKAEGEVSLMGASVGGNIECSNGTFACKGGFALNGDGLKAKGYVFLCDGFRAEGEVRLLNASIGLDLDCGKGSFLNPEGIALNGERIEVKGNVFLRDGFRAEGAVAFNGAKVHHAFQWMQVQSPQSTELSLRYAEVGTLWDEAKSWPEPGKLQLHGFKYSEISEKAPSDAKSRIDWLRRQPKDQFLPQPYEQLADVLRKSGREEDAREILIAKNQDPALIREMSWRKRQWHSFLELTICYGYRPMRAFRIGLFLIILGTLLFEAGCYFNAMMPTKQVISVTHETDSGLVVSDEYPRFISFVYSVDTFVPLVDLHQASYFLPNASSGLGLLLTIYMYAHIAFGWIITTLLVVSMTGLLKK